MPDADRNPTEQSVAQRVRVLEAGLRMLIEQGAETTVALGDVRSELGRLADGIKAMRAEPAIDFAHLEQAADLILAGDTPRMVRFWSDGHAKLVKHTWDALALAIGQRILTMIVTAMLVALLVWFAFKGPPQ